MVLYGRFTLRNRRIEYERRIARSENRSPTITLRGFAIKNRLRTNMPSLRAVGRPTGSYLSILWSRLKNPTFIRGLLALKTKIFRVDPERLINGYFLAATCVLISTHNLKLPEAPEAAAPVLISGIFRASVSPTPDSRAIKEGSRPDFVSKVYPQKKPAARHHKEEDCNRRLPIGDIARANSEPDSIFAKTQAAFPSPGLEE